MDMVFFWILFGFTVVFLVCGSCHMFKKIRQRRRWKEEDKKPATAGEKTAWLRGYYGSRNGKGFAMGHDPLAAGPYSLEILADMDDVPGVNMLREIAKRAMDPMQPETEPGKPREPKVFYPIEYWPMVHDEESYEGLRIALAIDKVRLQLEAKEKQSVSVS